MDNKTYGKSYYDNYDVGVEQVNYEDSPYTKDFLTGIAKRIVEDFEPRTVLDAGCAMGHLVAALRDLGVEAFGIDVSDYAISKVREDVRQYCAVGSIVEEMPAHFPDSFDLIVSIEVLEHLYEADGKAAIKNLCNYSNQFLFCSTPDDFDDPTHLNVRQREYWARCFADEGFYDDVNYRPTYLTYYAVLYKRGDDWKTQIEDYERNIRITEKAHKNHIELLSKAIEDKENHIQDQKNLIDEYELTIQDGEKTLKDNKQYIDTLTKELEQKDRLIEKQNERLNRVDNELSNANERINALESSTTWRVTKPIRLTMDIVKRTSKDVRRAIILTRKGVISLRRHGFRYTAKKIISRADRINSYSGWMNKPLFTEPQLAEQRKHLFSKDITFSILVPLYNTPDTFLREMIGSVIAQTYSKWELCLADGSDSAHEYVGVICRKYSEKDNRIKYRKLEKNLGISGNTNACIEIATGDYIALFDHDDIIHPAALHEMMVAICDNDADIVYTDEATFASPDIRDIVSINFKPDYAPDTLRSNNYICHFTAFNKSLLDNVGLFRSECDGSQDYDMILRLTEQTKKITHIPKVLYYWRAHTGSVAESTGVKPYTIEAAHRALNDHLERLCLKGEVTDTTVPSWYRIKYELKGNPLISIIIPNYEHLEDLNKCLNSIYEKTTYRNYEIIIVENNSKSSEIFRYYSDIQKKWNNIRVVKWEKEFNYSAINNFGAQYANGDHILLLNNDIEVISPNWLQEMLMFSQREDVGAVGSMLYYPDNTIQHAGVILGIGGVAGHSHKYFKRFDYGYMGRLICSQNLSAVTAACIMIRKDVWKEINGLDESFKIAFNDVDMCMRIREAGYLIVWTPFAELYHYESKSRGLEDTPEKQNRFKGEIELFQTRWKKQLQAGDPYYNTNLTLEREDFSLRP